jgi:GAF domain-containing protein
LLAVLGAGLLWVSIARAVGIEKTWPRRRSARMGGDFEESMEALSTSLRLLATALLPRQERARRAAEVIRRAGGYRWLGLYDVKQDEIVVIDWSGPGAPAHPTFARCEGLNGAAVVSRAPVVVQDVTRDSRYLPTLSDTRGEMIMPVTDDRGVVVGTIDVESAHLDAFRGRDHARLATCARALRPLWEQ